MSTRAAPDWLAEMQARFGATIRTPLDRATGTLRAATADYPAGAVADVRDAHNASGVERLAVYNRQYWFRLFTVMQTAFPLTTALLGAWRMNDYAARFLLAHPPRSWDLDRAPDGFERFVVEALEEDVPQDALRDAARLDAAWRALFRAPAAAPYRPRPEDAARLLDARLAPSPAVALYVERWPFIALKRAREGHRGEEQVALPPPHPVPQWWLLLREPEGIRQLPLSPREGELFALLAEHPVREALGRLEALCDERERATLPEQARRWLARGVSLGVWCGASFSDERR